MLQLGLLYVFPIIEDAIAEGKRIKGGN